MKSISKVCAMLLLLPAFSIAQNNYKPGSVVTVKGDTVRGFIDYRNWGSNPDEISFKSSLSDNEPQKFGLNDVTFFKVNGFSAYKKFTVSISLDETNTARLEHGKDTTSRIGTVFLKVLQTGSNVALYGYTDALKSRFYIGEAPGYKPAELTYRIYYNDTGTGVDNGYQKQLFALANKYNVLDDDLIKTIQNADYTEADLQLIASRINHISKSDYKKKYSDPTAIAFYAGAGINIVSYTFDGQSPYGADGGHGDNSIGEVFTGGMRIIPNPGSDALEFRCDLAIGLSSFNAQYQLTVDPYVPFKAGFDELDVALYPSIIYNIYNGANFKFYLGAGFNIIFANFSNEFFNQVGPQNATIYSFPTGADSFNFIKTDGEFLLKGGFRIAKKYELFANYLLRQPVTHGGYFGFDAARLQTGVIYHFGKL